jgi:anti-anti-sigma factor
MPSVTSDEWRSEPVNITTRSVRWAGGLATVVAVAGEVDVLSSPLLRSAHEVIAGAKPGSLVIIDLSRVLFLDSSGISTLIELCEYAARRRVVLRVVLGQAHTARRALSLTGVEELIEMHSTIEQALTG